MKRKLTSLATGELVAVLVFWMNFFLLKRWILTTGALISISFSLFVLSFILIQGSVFWWILIKRISDPGFAERYTGKIYRILKILDLILLGVGVPIIMLNYSEFPTSIISLAIWFFAVIEWMNYFRELYTSLHHHQHIVFMRISKKTISVLEVAFSILIVVPF